MTDREIIQALECCAKNPNEFICTESKCPLFGQSCIRILANKSLALITRQQAEIDRLTINMNAFGLGMKQEKERADTIKSEAIKEFAERLHTEINRVTGEIVQARNERLDQIESSNIVIPFDSVLHGYNSKIQAYDHINGFVDLQYKEMVGEDK